LANIGDDKDMIDKETEAEIRRLFYAEKWKIGTIAEQLGLHHSVIRRVLGKGEKDRGKTPRKRKIDDYLPLIQQTLAEYPTLSATRLFMMVKGRGYAGQISYFRDVINTIRPKPRKEAFLRLTVLPGEQAQVDWGHFGTIVCGKATRQLVAFVMVLSYSRHIFLRFYLSQSSSNFMHGHQCAFNWFGGVSRSCLYDNLKSVVTARWGRKIQFNEIFLDFAGAYRFEPRPVGVARGNEKGRVERSIRYIRDNFFCMVSFSSLEDLNAQALQWCSTVALKRPWPQDTSISVEEAFNAEKSRLMPLPENPFQTEDRKEVAVGKTPFARYDLNDYSVPPDFVGKPVTVMASPNTVRILHGTDEIASHPRSFDKGQLVVNQKHITETKKRKSAASPKDLLSTIAHAVPSAPILIDDLLQRKQNISRCVSRLMDLIRDYSPPAVEQAIGKAIGAGTPNIEAIAQILEQERLDAQTPPQIPVPLKGHPRLSNLTVKHHKTASYDSLIKGNKNEK
jgi:transposase